MTRLTRDDIISSAGRRFATYGYHGTSMRDLGDDLGILGSSIYAHVGGKQELLIAVVDRGAAFFAESAQLAKRDGSGALDTLQRLIAGHIDVVLDHRSEARTYLAEVPFLDDADRRSILDARDAYEDVFVGVIEEGIDGGSIGAHNDARLSAIYVLSILNAIDRWYDESGRLTREELATDMYTFVCTGLCRGPR
ncbi:MAG: TetR/AcrR family transcriptional regulator [Actinomycetia bacterium]|nr:TetR/AcrR family transcriptional regulator [Actinomycetes bacterium]